MQPLAESPGKRPDTMAAPRRFGRPNHSNYDNFLLKLTATAEGAAGEQVWKETLAAHWANCPAE